MGNRDPIPDDGLHLLVVELRGHGRSDRAPGAEYGFEALITEATAFVEEVCDPPAVLVGQSLGGLLALAIASRRPDLVRAVYCEDMSPASVVPGRDHSELYGFLTRVGVALDERSSREMSFLQFANRLAEAAPVFADTNPAGLVRFAHVIDGTHAALYSKLGDADPDVTSENLRAIETGVRCPVHVATADQSLGGVVSEADLESLRTAGVKLTTTHFPGAGHIITSSHAKELQADLRGFLQTVGA